MNYQKLTLAFGFAGALALAAPLSTAMAQQEGLVNVTITDVTILEEIGVQAQVPVTVQAPIGIAANVCPQVNAAALAQQTEQGGTAECEAQTTTRAFSNLVQRQIGQQ